MTPSTHPSTPPAFLGLSWNLVQKLINSDMQNSIVIFIMFCQQPVILFLQNSMVNLVFCFWLYLFLRGLFQKLKIVIFSIKNKLFGLIWSTISKLFLMLKFHTKTNLNLQNSMVALFFFYFRLKIPYSGQICSKNQNYSSWNLVPRLFWMCKIQWWYSLFLF